MAGRGTRREFLRGSAAAGVGFWVSGLPARAASTSPNEKLSIAAIGIGGRGGGNIDGVKGENLVALCDVDDARAGDRYKQFPKARKFYDYRRLFDAMHREIDAVVVSTPDHMHATITLDAMSLGKHVYCEKPLTRTIEEARRVAEMAAKHPKLATQMGNGGNSQSGARRAVEMLRSGVIGTVREVHAWTDRAQNWWPQPVKRPQDTPPVPDHLKWDLWLGVAPKRPYHPAYLPFKWRAWFDFGTGAMGDMACHICNVAFWGLDLRDAVSVEAETSERFDETYPAKSHIVWDFPAYNGRAALKFHWYDGGRRPPKELSQGHGYSDNGSLFVGDKGTMFNPSPDGAKPTLLPESAFADYKPPERTIPDSPGHHAEWIEACKKGGSAKDSMSHFERAGRMTECLLVGNLAVRAGRRLEWDSKEMKVTNYAEANAWVGPAWRKDW